MPTNRDFRNKYSDSKMEQYNEMNQTGSKFKKSAKQESKMKGVIDQMIGKASIDPSKEE